MVLTNAINWPMVDEKLQEHLQIKFTHSLFVMFDIFAISDFILHVFDLFLSRIETHTSHHVGNGTQWNLSIKLPCLGGMLIL